MCGDTDTKSTLALLTTLKQTLIDRPLCLLSRHPPRGGDKNYSIDKETTKPRLLKHHSEVISHALAISSSLDGFGSVDQCLLR